MKDINIISWNLKDDYMASNLDIPSSSTGKRKYNTFIPIVLIIIKFTKFRFFFFFLRKKNFILIKSIFHIKFYARLHLALDLAYAFFHLILVNTKQIWTITKFNEDPWLKPASNEHDYTYWSDQLGRNFFK